jgi:hypothetical protein
MVKLKIMTKLELTQLHRTSRKLSARVESVGETTMPIKEEIQAKDSNSAKRTKWR